MSKIEQLIGRAKMQWQGKDRVVGWSMSSKETISYIRSLGKTVVTFFGYSGMGYENEDGMLEIARTILSTYPPETTIVNIGATEVGIGTVYQLAKSMGFETSGVVATEALEDTDGISDYVDHICFVKDKQYGGKLPESDKLSPTSKAMVMCSDVLVAIGGNDIARDELLEGKKQGKPVLYFPADMNHDTATQQAESKGLPPPESFKGAVHDTFIGKKSALKNELKKTKDS